MTHEELKQLQSLPLETKILWAQEKVREWYEHWSGQVYISFSGGKDSTVLLDIVRGIYPDVPAVFVDTGLEYPEIRDFVKTIDNVVWLRPKMPFNKVIEKYGYPVISKSVSMGISRYRNTKCDFQKELRKHGGINPTSGKEQQQTIPNKYHYLIDAPFGISEKCCDVMKKEPFKRYDKESGRKPYIGTMAKDSKIREQDYLHNGCNSFELGSPKSKPLSIWDEGDIWQYIATKKIPYSKIYDMGETRTGCMFCMFGCHMEKANRFQRMAITHPKQYDYCMNHLGLKRVLEYLGIKYHPYEYREIEQKELF